MIKYPVSFHAKAESGFGIQSPWNFESQQVRNTCAVPSEFEGPGGSVLSPEDLFAQALTNCFIATFKVYSEKSKLVFGKASVETELVVDMDENKRPVMKTCFLKIKIAGCEKPDRVATIAKKALDSGFILNSVKTEIIPTIEVI